MSDNLQSAREWCARQPGTSVEFESVPIESIAALLADRDRIRADRDRIRGILYRATCDMLSGETESIKTTKADIEASLEVVCEMKRDVK